ncbi:hypothetical protein JCM8097_002693 [Rhodosporidiobolus ruineniae]
MPRLSLLSVLSLASALFASASPVNSQHDKLEKRGSIAMYSQPQAGTMTTCQTYTWTFSASPAPLTITLYDFKTSQTIRTLATGYSGSSISWKADAPVGSQIFLQIKTGDGGSGGFGTWPIQAGTDTSCVQCPTGYALRSGACVKCSVARAATCAAAGSPALTCTSPYKLIQSTGLCTTDVTCPTATYDDGNGNCVACGPNVATCTAAGPTACAKNFVSYGSTCVASCPTGTYADTNKICQNCVFPAATCYSATSANSCVDGYYWKYGACVQNCGDGHFPSTVNGFSRCTGCYDYATQCTSATEATACRSGYFLRPNKMCSQQCDSGTFKNTDKGTCDPCLNGATTCSSATVALSCNPGYFLKGTACVQDCGDGFWPQTIPANSFPPYAPVRKCSACAATALKCTSATVATECRDGSYLASDGSCGSTCSGASFANSSNKKCDTCTDSFAASCSAAGSLSCQDGHYLVAATSACTTDASCPAATFLDDTKKTCVSCSENAATCTASAATSCSGEYVLYQGACASKFCPTSFFNQDGVCAACVDPYAETCTPSESLTCLSGHKLVQSTSTCTVTDACPPATYDNDNGACVSCSANTASCTSSGSTACSGSYVLYNKACASTSCPSGFYNQDQVCTACSDPQSGHLLVASTGKCTTTSDGSCPATMYAVDQTCEACTVQGAYSCTASGATSCYQPTSSAKTYLSNGKCISASQCSLSKGLVFAWMKPTTQADGTVTYECATCPGLGIPNLFNNSKCLF